MNTLAQIQNEIKAPKGQFNKFGNYKYRSCEDIVEAAKPVLLKHGYALTISDDLVLIGSRFYVKATATITNGEQTFSATAFAREEESKKGMDGSQITGAASSYARKYALNGLFAIDDTKDADATNTHEDRPKTAINKDQLLNLLESSTYEEEMRKKMWIRINGIETPEDWQRAYDNLMANQLGYDGIPNPSATDAARHVRKIAKPA